MAKTSTQTRGLQAEDLVFDGVLTSLGSVMTLHRFKQLRLYFTFNAIPTTLPQDAAARIHPLLNLLKITGGQYIHVGRDIALDEGGVACRSRQGHHTLVPPEKYPFRLYMVCYSSFLMALNYNLHYSWSSVLYTLSGVVNQAEALTLREELYKVSNIRQHVLEVTRPLSGTNRVVNMDNYYISVQNVQELHLKLRANSKHYPSHTILNKGDCSRGDYNIAVSSNHGIFPAPECVANYKYMQGVDRLDQMRGRFSVVDGHSYQWWYKILALALIDVASSNAYLTRRLVKLEPTTRNPHIAFIIELISEASKVSGQTH
ncbi:Transposase [Phytophthora megakarya]|uniref:Transposase n=1 Tax=Phytophthora megakarya TaxID=4795 RepID=A0A225W575_9STRA|nr:Transposase [Phytophthora megakarya]